MKINKSLSLAIKIILLTIFMFIVWSTFSAIILETPQNANNQSNTALSFLLVCFFNTLIISYIIIKSDWSGIKLSAAIFLNLFGIQTFMAQIETLYFNHALEIPLNQVVEFMILGGLTALIFSPAAVFLLGKFRKKGGIRIHRFKFDNVFKKMLLLSLIYTIIYLIFGYFVAWQFPRVRLLYSGSREIVGFFTHVSGLIVEDVWLIPYQILRGLLWVIISLPVIYMMKGRKWETAFAVALSFSVLMNSQHLLPNPYMEPIVRLAHFIETFSSNFIFGIIVVLVMYSGQGKKLVN